MKNKKYLFGLMMISPFILSCNVDFKKIEKKAAMINHYENVALKLAQENRELHVEIKRLEFEIEKLKQENALNGHKEKEKEGHENHKVADHHEENATNHSTENDSHANVGRSVASIAGHMKVSSAFSGKDFVEFATYKWRAEDMQQIADKEFKEKQFEKAAQFYFSILQNYPHYKKINDEFYFKAGIAAYESGNHHDWTLEHFEALMKNYPTSQYYRSSKLWVGLTHLKLGDKKKFFATVEEFRKKYRNTNEWKVLSSYYEKIEEKTNE